MEKTRLTGLGALCLLAGAAHADLLYSEDFESGRLGPEWAGASRISQEDAFSFFNGNHNHAYVRLDLDIPGGKESKSVGGLGGGIFAGAIGKDRFGDGGGGGGDGGDGGDGGGDSGGDGGGDGGGGDGGGSDTNLYSLKFDFYAFDSWDGDHVEYGPDTFEVLINGTVLFSETISNQGGIQSFRDADIGPEHLGMSPRWKDSIYRDVTVVFELPGDQTELTVQWRDRGLQSVYDESWGIDNVRFSRVNPAIPAPGVLLPAGLGLLFGARRRR